MVFYIYNQGIRQEESLAKLLQEQQIRAVQASNRVRKVGPKTHSQQQSGASVYSEAEPRHAREPALLARQLMTAPVQTLLETAMAADAWALFRHNPFHHIPIVDAHGQLIGILTDSDLLTLSSTLTQSQAFNPATTQVKQIAQTQVISSSATTGIRELADLMVTRRVGCVPIVNDQHQVEGIVTRTDILRALVQQAPIELWV